MPPAPAEAGSAFAASVVNAPVWGVVNPIAPIIPANVVDPSALIVKAVVAALKSQATAVLTCHS